MAIVIFGKTISEWVLKPLVRWIGGGLGLLAIIWGFGAYKESVGKRELLDESKKAGIEKNEKSQEHHASARRTGAADRLRKDSCRNC